MRGPKFLTGLLLAAAAAAAPAQSEVELGRHVARMQDATVLVLSQAVDEARSSETLGERRIGSGVLIGADGLVLTIGYLVLEAESVDLIVEGRRVPARVVAYDLASGFGLVQALTPLAGAPAALGDPQALQPGQPLVVVSGDGDASLARIVSRRAFSGYWEYHIDGALFTVPARGDHSGAGLFDAEGRLLGIGSLVVPDALGRGQPRLQGNMFVPVDLLKPILAELRERGQSQASRRAWIGVNCLEGDEGVEIVRVNRDSPAEDAGLQPGDRIVALDGVAVKNLEAFYKGLWRDGAERTVRVEVRRAGRTETIDVRTRDRGSSLRKPVGV